jgi:hypothetical protein
MKKLVVLGLVLLVASISAFAQGAYLVDYFANNSGPVPGAADQVLRLVNTGRYGTPLTSPTGDICSNIYVFDNNQEMIACCACRTTPNELATASVGTQLTNNPVTSVVPAAGVIKIVNTLPAPGCDPTALSADGISDSIVGFATHLQSTGGATYVTETNVPDPTLSAPEFFFLQTACSFAHYLGSGKGTCSCSAPGL